MVHDLRGPAQSLAFIPAMWEDRSSAEDRRWLDALAVACDRLTGNIALIDRLLGGTAERRPPEPVAIDDVLGFVSRLVGARRRSLTVEVAPSPRSLLPPVTAVRRDLEAAVRAVRPARPAAAFVRLPVWRASAP
ncbi:MAG: hypothetical protein M3Q93_07125 [Gemmatimonadota bacterium]|nr:hypothetical protein [Gemmatimonadota bacterium]